MKTGLLKAAKCLFTNDVIIWPLHWRSLQCPPNSCRNPVIPGESGGFRRNELWQEGLLFSSFQFLIILVEFTHSGIETGMFCGMHWNPVVCVTDQRTVYILSGTPGEPGVKP